MGTGAPYCRMGRAQQRRKAAHIGGSHGPHVAPRCPDSRQRTRAHRAHRAKRIRPRHHRASEGALRARQEGRRGHLVHRAFQRHDRAGARPRLRGGVPRHQGERRAHHRAGRLPAPHAGAARQRHAGRRVLLDRHRPLRGAEREEPAGEIRAGQRQQGDRGLQELRSGRVLHRHLGGPDRDRLQHREAEGSRRAEELDRPHRSEMEGQDRARAIRASPAMSAPGWSA